MSISLQIYLFNKWGKFIPPCICSTPGKLCKRWGFCETTRTVSRVDHRVKLHNRATRASLQLDQPKWRTIWMTMGHKIVVIFLGLTWLTITCLNNKHFVLKHFQIENKRWPQFYFHPSVIVDHSYECNLNKTKRFILFISFYCLAPSMSAHNLRVRSSLQSDTSPLWSSVNYK